MKKVLLFVTLFIVSGSYGQSNLSFFEVNTITLDSVLNSCTYCNETFNNIRSYTVPENSIAKINSIHTSLTGGVSQCNKSAWVTVNDVQIGTDILDGTWLKSGDKISFSANRNINNAHSCCYACPAGSYIIYMSYTEYLITPN